MLSAHTDQQWCHYFAEHLSQYDNSHPSSLFAFCTAVFIFELGQILIHADRISISKHMDTCNLPSQITDENNLLLSNSLPSKPELSVVPWANVKNDNFVPKAALKERCRLMLTYWWTGLILLMLIRRTSTEGQENNKQLSASV